MTRHPGLLLLTSALAFAADNPWTKVQELKHGTEIRIVRKSSRELLLARFDEANEERILIVAKTSQMAVAREDIDRLDARPASKTPGRKLTTESTAKTTDPDYTPHPPGGVPVPGTSYGSNVSFGGGKPDFETIYRRVAPMPRHP